MWFDLLFPIFFVAMVGGGVAVILYPDASVVGTNPTLELLEETFPDWLALRIVQGLGGVVILSALFFFYVLYLC